MLARRGENVYTAPSLLNVAGALATLPDLSLQDVAQADAGTGESGLDHQTLWTPSPVDACAVHNVPKRNRRWHTRHPYETLSATYDHHPTGMLVMRMRNG